MAIGPLPQHASPGCLLPALLQSPDCRSFQRIDWTLFLSEINFQTTQNRHQTNQSLRLSKPVGIIDPSDHTDIISEWVKLHLTVCILYSCSSLAHGLLYSPAKNNLKLLLVLHVNLHLLLVELSKCWPHFSEKEFQSPKLVRPAE